MSKYVMVEKEGCISCGNCVAVTPEVFEFDGDDLSGNILDDNTGTKAIPEELEASTIESVESCPTETIKCQDEPFAS